MMSAMDMCEDVLKKNKGKWVSVKEIAMKSQINYSRALKACEGLLKRNIIERKNEAHFTPDLCRVTYRWVDA